MIRKEKKTLKKFKENNKTFTLLIISKKNKNKNLY